MALHLRLMLALLLLVTLAPATPAPAAQPAAAPGLPATVPMGPGFDSFVYATAEFGDHIYLGGEFTYATTGPGGLIAYDAAGGTLITEPAPPRLDDAAHALSADGAGGYYLGGRFTHVNRIARAYLAHIRADGTLNNAWTPEVDDPVMAMAVSDGMVYVATWPEYPSNGEAHQGRLQAYSATTGALVWSHTVDNVVRSIVIGAQTLYVGGMFRTINSSDYSGLAAIDLVSGSLQAWKPSITHTRGTPVISTLAFHDSMLYVGGSFTHVEGEARQHLVAFNRATDELAPWAPQPNAMVHTLSVNADRLWALGIFETMASTPRRHLAAFALADLRLQEIVLPESLDPIEYENGIAIADNVVTVLTSDSTVDFMFGRIYRAFSIDLGTGDIQSSPPMVGHNRSVRLLGALDGRVFISDPDIGVEGGVISGLARIDAATGALDHWQPPDVVTKVVQLLAGPNRLYIVGEFRDLPAGEHLRAFDPLTNAFDAWSVAYGGAVSNLKLINDELIYYDRVPLTLPSGEPNPDSFAGGEGLVATNIHTGATRLFALAEFVPVESARFITGQEIYNGRLYVGGRFLTYPMNGDVAFGFQNALVAVDIATGELVPWLPKLTHANPEITPSVRSMALYGSTLYISGHFDAVNGEARAGLAAFNLEDGSLLPWQTEPVELGLDLQSAGPYLYVFVQRDQKAYVQAIDRATGAVHPTWRITFDISDRSALMGMHAASKGLLLYGNFSAAAGLRQRLSAFFPFTQTGPEQPGEPPDLQERVFLPLLGGN